MSSFPCMLTARRNHSAVSISNKIFIIGGRYFKIIENFEVFDSVTRKYTSIKRFPFHWIEHSVPNKTVCVGYKIYCFIREEKNEVKVNSYDVKENNFIFKTLLKHENAERFCCTKVAMF